MGGENGVKDRMMRNRELRGLACGNAQYLWMFISLLVLREAHIFHLGIAGQHTKSSSWDLERLKDSTEDKIGQNPQK